MKKPAILFLSILLSFLISPSATYASDGNELLASCNAAIKYLDDDLTVYESSDVALCFGLVKGVHDTSMIYNAALKENNLTEITMCFPQNSSVRQATRVVHKYLKENPEALHETDTLLILKALIHAFPCNKN